MYSGNPTGVGIYTKQIWNNFHQQLVEQNIEPTVFSYSADGLKDSSHITRVKLPLLLNILLKKFISVHRLIWNVFYLPFKAKQFDLIYSFSTHGSPFVKNQIITIHDLICFTYPQQHKFQFLYFKYIVPSIIRACFKVVVISEFTRQEVIRHFKVAPEKIIVIYNGGDHLANTNLASLSEKDIQAKQVINKPFFLTVGASYPHKNIPRLLTAMQKLQRDVLLIIVGFENKYYRKLKLLAAQNNAHNIIFLNYVSPALLNDLYKNCVANVYISLYEGFGFPPFEAALNGKASILSNAGSLPEIYSGTAVFVNPLDVSQIANALDMVCSADFNKEFYLNKFSYLKTRFTWQSTANEVMRLLVSFRNKKFA